MRPRVRRIRRWSFLVTLPGGYLLARGFGIELTLERGLRMGIAVALLDLAILLTVVLTGSRLLGRERQAVLLDFLMHPLARRAIRGEARMLWTYVRGFRRRGARRRDRAEFTYHRGSSELGFALALIPAVLAEGAVVHLLLPDGWFWPKLALPAVQAYGLLMLVAWALGPRVYPHRLTGGTLELRLGQLYVARIPIGLIDRAERRTEKVERAGAQWRTGEALLPARGRVDVRLVLSAPIEVERPLGEPVAVSMISIAVDDPRSLLAELDERRTTSTGGEEREAQGLVGWLAPVADLLDAATAS